MSAATSTAMPVRISLVLSRNGRRGEGGALRLGLGAGRGCGRVSRSVSAISALFLRVEQLLQLGHEFADVTEVPIDRGESDVCHLIQPLELLHDDAPDLFCAHLLLGTLLERGLDPVGDTLDRTHADRPLLARFQQARNELLPLESLPAAILLDDHIGNLIDALVAGEPSAAAEALSPSPDDLAFLAFARVDDLVAQMAAEGALHGRSGTSLVPSPR